MTKIIFLAFAGGKKYEAVMPRFTWQCKQLCSDAEVRVFTKDSLPSECYKDFEFFDFQKTKGFGYWAWKPWLVDYVLKAQVEDSIVFYIDIGCEINYYAEEKFSEYISYVEKNGSLFFELQWTNRQYCKAELLNNFSSDLRDMKQVMATVFAVKNSTSNTVLLQEWLSLSKNVNRKYLIDPDPSEPQDSEFKAHRHDQSILSLLVRKHNMLARSDETWFPRFWKGMRFPILAKRSFESESSIKRMRIKYLLLKWFVKTP